MGTPWIWNAWAIAGAWSMSTSTSWNLPACSRAISSSMASAGLDSSERGDHMIIMTGTAWEVDMTSWKFSSSVVVISGMCKPSPAAGAEDSSEAGELARADRSTAPCESAGMGVATDAGRGSGVVMVSSSSKQLLLRTMICVVPTTLSRGDDVCAVGENQPGLDEGSSVTDTMAYSPPTIWGLPPAVFDGMRIRIVARYSAVAVPSTVVPSALIVAVLPPRFMVAPATVRW